MTPIKTFFLRVSARCNLNCSYCYVFKHRDKTWKNYPATMSEDNIILFSKRLKEYVSKTGINTVNIIFHGGEPLLIGNQRLFRYTDILSSSLEGIAEIEFSIQTNGTLITKDFLEGCNSRNIRLSISVDGPKIIHNRRRSYPNGNGSYDDVLSGITATQNFPQMFQGVIGVIDPFSDPSEVLNFYRQNSLYNIDLLLPDANYECPPSGRDKIKNLYKNWVVTAFDLWFDEYQDISFKTYEFILKSLLGSDDSSDSFGLGKLNYITIETDGSYHTTDILKVAYENASAMGKLLDEMTIEDAVNHAKIHKYNDLLTHKNLHPKCKSCDVVSICGGGSLPHRYSDVNGFSNPTIYCKEMYALITHAKARLEKAIDEETRI